jgi:uncharacterized protein YndB with AHSA1/START domain
LVTYGAAVDLVFKALAGPTRRDLLDELFRQDGQTLSQLDSRFTMTRFGVMKHLKVLEEAGLVVTRKQGREKLHFLNPVPIRLVHDRWVSKYAEPIVAGLSDLKSRLETPVQKVFEIYIKTTPERLWEAITDPEQRPAFHFGNTVSSEWTDGSSWALTNPAFDGGPLMDGENVEVDPPCRLVQTATVHWSPDAEALGSTTVTWEIEPIGEDSCRLRLTHEMPEHAQEDVWGGWPMVLSGLKTYLETGETLTTPGSLMYG